MFFRSAKFEEAGSVALVIVKFGSFVLVPAVFIVEGGLILAQSSFNKPSIIFQSLVQR